MQGASTTQKALVPESKYDTSLTTALEGARMPTVIKHFTQQSLYDADAKQYWL